MITELTLEQLRPHNWDESMAVTLAAIRREAEEHTTENLVCCALDPDEFEVEVGAVEWSVSMLRARAVVLAAEVAKFDVEHLKSTMVAFFIDKYKLKYMQQLLESPERPADLIQLLDAWVPHFGQQAQASADADQIIERLSL